MSGSPANRSSPTSAMTALHLLVVVLTVVTAVAEYHPPELPAGGYGKSSKYANKPDYKKTEYGDKPTYPPVYDSKPDYTKPEYGGKTTHAPVYDSKPTYKKPEYESKTTYAPVYDSKPTYKKPEYEGKTTYGPVYDSKTTYKKPEYEGKPTYAPVYDSKPDYEVKPNYGPVYDSKPYEDKFTAGSVPEADVQRANDVVITLFGSTDELIKELNTYQTLIGVAAERLSLINQRTLPALTLDNSQTDAAISLLVEMIDSLRDRAARADVTATAALASANASSDVIRQQRALVAQISKNNTDDARSIAQFQGDLRNLEAYFLKELDTQIGQLTSLLAKERQNLKTVTAFVNGRKCEYGFVVLVSGIDTVSVPFETAFTQPPTVDFVLSGYSSSIDAQFFSHDDYPPRATNGDNSQGDDSSHKSTDQNVQIVVSDVTARGFTARVINSSPDNFQSARAVYVACQNLNNELRL
ncbi:uncharacterized protein LOC112562576 [Pomacea canaliculata]|uniref:uncharacterized protein LOC112562576 n=1 Tax=Pomacea canaliculata TaxID=400727 RepID=UPI000D73C94E|nr:uncharacterized protein LOC112562576 [Pomacea canaliculata]